MLVRKQCENPTDYFDKTFAEYQEGFEANGEFQKVDKMTKTCFSRRGLDRAGQASSADQWKILLAEDNNDWLRQENICCRLQQFQSEL